MNVNISGHRIRIARAMQQPSISQQELAKKCQLKGWYGVTKGIISNIELGIRNVSDIELTMIADVLNVSINWLVKESDNPKREEVKN